jgi:hypothetical protein
LAHCKKEAEDLIWNNSSIMFQTWPVSSERRR